MFTDTKLMASTYYCVNFSWLLFVNLLSLYTARKKRLYVYDIFYFDRIDSKVCKILIFLYFGKFTFFWLINWIIISFPRFSIVQDLLFEISWIVGTSYYTIKDISTTLWYYGLIFLSHFSYKGRIISKM